MHKNFTKLTSVVHISEILVCSCWLFMSKTCIIMCICDMVLTVYTCVYILFFYIES